MSNFSVNIDDTIETRFRKAAMEKHGLKKGYLTRAIEEAFEDFAVKIEKGKKQRAKCL